MSALNDIKLAVAVDGNGWHPAAHTESVGDGNWLGLLQASAVDFVTVSSTGYLTPVILRCSAPLMVSSSSAAAVITDGAEDHREEADAVMRWAAERADVVCVRATSDSAVNTILDDFEQRLHDAGRTRPDVTVLLDVAVTLAADADAAHSRRASLDAACDGAALVAPGLDFVGTVESLQHSITDWRSSLRLDGARLFPATLSRDLQELITGWQTKDAAAGQLVAVAA